MQFLSGSFNENSISQVKESLSKTLAIKKKDSLQKFSELNLDDVTKLVEDAPLLEPLKSLNLFVDSKLLMEAIEHRQKRRMLRRQSLISLNKKGEEKVILTKDQFDNRNETFLKGVYVFVYLFMFTALNLEYKCIQ